MGCLGVGVLVNERWVGVAVSGLGRLGSGRVWQGWQGLAAVWRHTMGWGGVGGVGVARRELRAGTHIKDMSVARRAES